MFAAVSVDGFSRKDLVSTSQPGAAATRTGDSDPPYMTSKLSLFCHGLPRHIYRLSDSGKLP